MMDDVKRMKENGLDLSYWNVSSGNYKACLSHNPRRMTLQNNMDIHKDWDLTYLKTLSLW